MLPHKESQETSFNFGELTARWSQPKVKLENGIHHEFNVETRAHEFSASGAQTFAEPPVRSNFLNSPAQRLEVPGLCQKARLSLETYFRRAIASVSNHRLADRQRLRQSARQPLASRQMREH